MDECTNALPKVARWNRYAWIQDGGSGAKLQSCRGLPLVMDPDLRRDDGSHQRLQSGLVSVRNPAAGQIVRRYLNRYTVAFEDTNAKAAEFTGDGCQHCRAIVQRDAKRRARKDFGDGPFEFNQVFFGDTVL